MIKKICAFLCIFILIYMYFIPVMVYAKTSIKTSENFANVILFAYFDGKTAEEDKNYFTEHYDEIMKMYDGEQTRSVKNYLKKISYDKFNIVNIFPQDEGNKINAYKLPFDINDAYNSNIDYSIISEMIKNIPSIQNKVIDYNNDGVIDNLTIFLKGGEKPTGVSANSTPTFVSHKSDFPGTDKYSGKNIGTFNVLNSHSIIDNYGESGVIVHEFLHSLGYPDLYRRSSTDDNPVHIWDIMASANNRMPYPLAYERMKISNWIDIEEITTSQTLTLDSQENPNGNQAYILKSPANEYELFIVEFRKKGDYYDEEVLDGAIAGSGIIVYRVNTTVTSMSNYFGDTAIYVFRPEGATIREAYLSQEIGRTTFGKSDINDKNNALTFSDGSNSGIVISDVGSAEGNQITFKVTIPDAKEFDLWNDINYPDLTGSDTFKTTDMIYYNNKLYTVNAGNSKLYTHVYDNNNWNQMGNGINLTNSLDGMSLQIFRNELYLFANEYGKITVYKLTNNTWSKITSLEISELNEASYIVFNSNVYINTVHSFYKSASLYSFNGTNITKIETYMNDINLLGDPKLEILNDSLHVVNRRGDGKINLFKYENGTFSAIQNSMNSNTYDVKTLNNKMYFVLGKNSSWEASSDAVKIFVYNGASFEEIQTDITEGFPKVVLSQGNLYFITSSLSGTEKTKVYSFDENAKTLKQEGNNVDNASDSTNSTLVSVDNKIYVILKRSSDNKILVKCKETNNSLISLSIIPPKTTSYLVGDSVSDDGLIVYANYTNQRKEVSNYQISNFKTDTPGEFNATVTYEGISNTFSYTISEKNTNYLQGKNIYVSFPNGLGNDIDNGTGSISDPYTQLTTAIKNANDGDTIIIKNNAFINSTNDDLPLIIDKKLTIKGEQENTSLQIRKCGILLEKDVTFENIKLQMGSIYHPNIYANGNKLKLNNVIFDDTAKKVHVFGGGLNIPLKGHIGNAAKEDSEIIILGKTNLTNIYAGSMNEEYNGNVKITISSDVSRTQNDTNKFKIYSCGAKEPTINSSDWFGEGLGLGDDPVVRSDDDTIFYNVSGNIEINTYDNNATYIEGNEKTTLNLNGSNNNIPNVVLKNLGNLNVLSGDFNLKTGTTFTNNININISSNGMLNIKNLNSIVTINNFIGGGTLILGKNQKLNINGQVEDKTTLAIDEIFNGTSGSAKIDNIYIVAPLSQTESFKFAKPNSNQPGMSIKLLSGGNWKTYIDDHNIEDFITILKDISISDKTINDGIQHNQAILKMTPNYAPSTNFEYIDDIPFDIKINNKLLQRIEEEGEYLYKTGDNSSDLHIYIANSQIYLNKKDYSYLDAGVYNFEIIIPKEFTENNFAITKTFKLTIVDSDNQECNHILTKTNKKESTCTTTGNIEYYTCATCKNIFSDDKGTNKITDIVLHINQNAHSWGEWTTTKEATTSTTGEKTRKCKYNSNHQEKSIIPVIKPQNIKPIIRYQTHVQNDGWQAWKSEGQMSGTSGRSLRLEGIRIQYTNNPGLKIKYQVHVQDVGWQEWKYNGDMAGTSGRSLRLEGIRILLENSDKYSIQYRVHVQNDGWQSWKTDGEMAGTSGRSLRLEGIEIRIVPKQPRIQYKSHVQNIGWQEYVSDGEMSGTSGLSYRVEAMNIKLVNAPKDAKILYRAHVQNIGWQTWKENNQIAGTLGQSLRIEALQIKLENLNDYRLEYRAHIQDIGWTKWLQNGETAGTVGLSKRIEAIQIRLVKK